MDTKVQRRQFGKRLTEAREGKGLSLSAFARAVNVAPPTALGWERGDYSPSAGSLRRISAALGVTVDALLISGRAA